MKWSACKHSFTTSTHVPSGSRVVATLMALGISFAMISTLTFDWCRPACDRAWTAPALLQKALNHSATNWDPKWVYPAICYQLFGGVACVEGGGGFGESDSLISPIWFRSSSANRRSSASGG